MRTSAGIFSVLRAAAIAFAIHVSAVSTPQAQQLPGQAEAGLEVLQIITSSGSHKFSVEVMRNDEERARGLMYRRSMPPDRGMLFDFKREEHVMMWMKNTYIPLDMVFIARTGAVVSVAQNTEPLSERTIPSGGPAYAVLELNGGTAARIGLKAGDRIEHSLFRR